MELHIYSRVRNGEILREPTSYDNEQDRQTDELTFGLKCMKERKKKGKICLMHL